MHWAPADIIKKKVIFHLAGTRLSNTKPHLFSLSTKDLILFPGLLQRFTITLSFVTQHPGSLERWKLIVSMLIIALKLLNISNAFNNMQWMKKVDLSIFHLNILWKFSAHTSIYSWLWFISELKQVSLKVYYHIFYDFKNHFIQFKIKI